LGVFVVEENWRGNRAWTKCEHDLLARGERIDFAALQAAPVPDNQNFCKTPLLDFLLYKKTDKPLSEEAVAISKSLDHFDAGGFFRGGKDFSTFCAVLLKSGFVHSIARGSPAAAVLDAMKPMAPLLDEMREAARSRPFFQFRQQNSFYNEPMVLFDRAFQIGQVLSVRAFAELELGYTAEAYSDLFTLQRFANGFSQQQPLLSLLVGIALQDYADSAMQEGCRRHFWGEAQLAEFQRCIDGIDPLEKFRAALAAERISFVHALDGNPVFISKPFWMFHGWAQQNKVVYCHQLDAMMLSRIGLDPDRILPKPSKVGDSGSRFHAFNWLSRRALVNLEKILIRYGVDVDRLRLSSTALALERYRLSFGRHPEKLDQLVPRFLPNLPAGVFDGKPVGYETQLNGDILLRFTKPPRLDSKEAPEDSILQISKA
jgi:hypothetical protein